MTLTDLLSGPLARTTVALSTAFVLGGVIGLERQFRQQRIEQFGLPRFERMAFAPPEEGALRCVVAVVMFVHAANHPSAA